MQDESIPHYLGHRQRLKERLFSVPAESWAEYELLELILFFELFILKVPYDFIHSSHFLSSPNFFQSRHLLNYFTCHFK